VAAEVGGELEAAAELVLRSGKIAVVPQNR
jgi:hypothetical protein